MITKFTEAVCEKKLSFARHHGTTEFIEINTRLCEACGKCVEACVNDVLSVFGFLWHKHVHIDHAPNCKGCRKCVKACVNGAIKPRPRSQNSA